jgi:hypothetical protein
VTLPKPQARDFNDKYSWVVSPRIYDKRTDSYVACDTGGGPFARQWVTAKAGLVDLRAEGDGQLDQMTLPKTGFMPEMDLEWKIPEKSNAIERDRARSYHQAYSAIVAVYHLEEALKEIRAGRTRSANNVTVPESAVSVGFHEAARGVLSHHMVIRDGKVANYQPYPPTPWNANPRDSYGTPGPTRTPSRTRRSSRRTARTTSRASTSCGRPLVRSLPAVRRAHVHGQGQGAEGGAHADGAVLSTEPEALVARVEELTAQLEPGGARRGAGGRADGPLRGGPRAHLRRDRRGRLGGAARAPRWRTGWSRACC